MTSETTLMAKVRARCNLNANDARLTDVELRYFLNDAIQFCGVAEDWPWHLDSESINTVADTATITLNADARVIQNLSIAAEDQVIEEITARKAIEFGSMGTGRPRWAVIRGNTATLYPTPNKVYAVTHNYYTYADATTTGTDEVDSPDVFDHLIVTKASIYVAEKLRDSELAHRFDQTFRVDMKEAKALATNTRASIGLNTRDDWGV